MNRSTSTDPVTLDPDKFKIRLENELVRVLEAKIPSGEGHSMHWHPQHLIFTLSSYKVCDTFPDGTTKTMERGAGEILWCEELTHATQNIGKTEVSALIIEFKAR